MNPDRKISKLASLDFPLSFKFEDTSFVRIINDMPIPNIIIGFHILFSYKSKYLKTEVIAKSKIKNIIGIKCLYLFILEFLILMLSWF